MTERKPTQVYMNRRLWERMRRFAKQNLVEGAVSASRHVEQAMREYLEKSKGKAGGKK